MRSKDWMDGGERSAPDLWAAAPKGGVSAGDGLVGTPPGSSDGRGKPRSPVIRALSWLMTAFIEGCAAYGEAMYPGFPDPSYYSDQREPETKPVPKPVARRPRNGRARFSVAGLLRLRPRYRRQRETKLTTEMLNDREWENEDLYWRHIEYPARYGLPQKW
ncbi:MAG: hypothetical protein QOD93_3550 [Acetobacteraceae bacterium]|nr:hypothetical protein [Acetobacteraceae bacterium]